MIIGLVIGCGATSVVWIVYEWFIGSEYALLPLRFCRNRSVCGSSRSSFFAMLALFMATYYLPLCMFLFSSLAVDSVLDISWMVLEFQAVQGDSATSSGL
jgi:hypothetical protein